MRGKSWRRVARPPWTAPAWGAIGATALFLAITCWWLTQDRSIPIFDAGLRLTGAFYVFEELGAGHVVHALTLTAPYPPVAFLVGDLGSLFGGVNVAPPIIAENFVFVPLLALGCYHVGRIAFNRTAGLLAVIFALGSPLITAQFHVFMTDAPETAMVAVSLWAILATDGFTDVRLSAAAGLAVGLGMLTKEPFVFYAAGPLAVTAIRGRQQAWRGLLVFALVALAIAGPWYVHELAQVKSLGSAAIAQAGSSVGNADIAPTRLSFDNLEWYFWNMISAQLYAPLFAFSAIGWLWTLVGFMRRKWVSRVAPELATGAFVAWLAITQTFPHDTRYSMPLLVYLAVFGSGWITRLPRTGRVVAAAALVLVSSANVAGTSFGVGGQVSLTMPGANTSFMQHTGALTFYSNTGFLVSAAHRDGDLPATLQELKRNGVTAIVVESSTVTDPGFSLEGLIALADVAGLETVLSSNQKYAALRRTTNAFAFDITPPVPAERLTTRDAVLLHGQVEPGEAPPCVRLADGTGVWIRLGNPDAPGARDYCPSRQPRFYPQ